MIGALIEQMILKTGRDPTRFLLLEEYEYECTTIVLIMTFGSLQQTSVMMGSEPSLYKRESVYVLITQSISDS